jgi:hypothetical protein
MNRAYLCAAVAVALCAVSFPATALIFGAGSTNATRASSSSPSAEPAPLIARGPDGNSVRVISLIAMSAPTGAEASQGAALHLSDTWQPPQAAAVDAEAPKAPKVGLHDRSQDVRVRAKSAARAGGTVGRKGVSTNRLFGSLY